MPIYEYKCDHCGPFLRFRPLVDSGNPTSCPACGAISLKIFPLVNLRTMAPHNRSAWERNERSAHAPHVCGTGCAHRQRKQRTKAGDKPPLQFSTKANSRPWMLGH